MKKAVFSFFTMRTSGDFPWWDKFPLKISYYLKKENIDHLCFYRSYSNNSQYPINERHQLTHSQISNPNTVRRILSPHLENYDEVILHHHTYSFPCGLWILQKFMKKKIHWVITDHNGWATTKFSILKRNVRILLRYSGFLPEIIIGCSVASKRRLQQIYGKKNVISIFNGIDLPDVLLLEPLSTKPTQALFVGRLEEYKGLWPLVQAFKIMKNKIDVSLVILGNGSLYKQLYEFTNKNKLTNITLVGHNADISHFYKENHFVIIPSIIDENFTIVSLEAQSYYLPCIYTNSGGLPESQINYKTGIMIPKDSPDSIVEAIRFFREDIGRFNQMRIAARENSMNFTMDKMAQNYADLYIKIFKNENIHSYC